MTHEERIEKAAREIANATCGLYCGDGEGPGCVRDEYEHKTVSHMIAAILTRHFGDAPQSQPDVERITHTAIRTGDCADDGWMAAPIPNSHYAVSKMFDRASLCPRCPAGKGPLANPKRQGFTTSTGRFVDREEAMKIALAAGQVTQGRTYQPDELFSEDFTSTTQSHDAVEHETAKRGNKDATERVTGQPGQSFECKPGFVHQYFADAVAVSNRAHGYPNQPSSEGPLQRLDEDIERVQQWLNREAARASSEAPRGWVNDATGESVTVKPANAVDVTGPKGGNEETDALRDALTELLRLYDWRKELAAMEDGAAAANVGGETNLKTLLLRYGREKKAAWERAREVLSIGSPVREQSEDQG